MVTTYAQAKKLRKQWFEHEKVNPVEVMTEIGCLVRKRIKLLGQALAEENKISLDEVENLSPQTELGQKARTRYLLLQAAMM